MVKLTYGGNLLHIDPWVPALERHLVFDRKTFDQETQRMKSEEEALFALDGSGGYVSDGMGDRVQGVLEDLRVPFCVCDNRKWAFKPEPDWNAVDLKGLRKGQDDMLLEVSTHMNGVFDAPTGFGKTHVIVQICRMYPQLTIAIATPRRPVVAEIHKRLQADMYTRNRVRMSLDKQSHFPGKITVSTTKSLLLCHPEKCDLLIIDECHCIGADSVTTAVAEFRGARRFGFSASPKGRGDGAWPLMESLLGPIRIEIPYQNSVDAGAVVPIKVRIRRIDGTIPERWSKVSQKRVGLWRNMRRNQVVAQEASKLLAEGIQTLVMVETVEHMLFLSKLLPGWPLVHGPLSKEDHAVCVAEGYMEGERKTQKDMDKLVADFSAGNVHGIISTLCLKEGVDFKRLGALVRADGQGGSVNSVQIPGRLSRLFEGKTHGLLVDFLDEFHDSFKGSSYKRIKVYKEKGWEISYA